MNKNTTINKRNKRKKMEIGRAFYKNQKGSAFLVRSFMKYESNLCLCVECHLKQSMLSGHSRMKNTSMRITTIRTSQALQLREGLQIRRKRLRKDSKPARVFCKVFLASRLVGGSRDRKRNQPRWSRQSLRLNICTRSTKFTETLSPFLFDHSKNVPPSVEPTQFEN